MLLARIQLPWVNTGLLTFGEYIIPHFREQEVKARIAPTAAAGG